MPVELAPAVELPVPPRSPVIYPPRKRWTRAECERIEATGLWDRDRVELIDVASEDNPTSEPEPDMAVLAKVGTEYPVANPPASDVRLVIEISDSTLAFDLGPKARLYARAGIPEYWVFDIGGRRVIVHRGPAAGGYSMVTTYAEGEIVAPLAFPGALFPVAVAFPFPADLVSVGEV
jgi:Uma2 family endonuclease